MLKIKKLLCLLSLTFLQGCLTTNEFNNNSLNKVNLDNHIKSNIVNSSAKLKKNKSNFKRPKYAPYDWSENDGLSRMIWFEDNGRVYNYCSGLTGEFNRVYKYYDTKSRKVKRKKNYVLPKDSLAIKKLFLRNGNIIHTFYVPETVKEI